MTARDNHQAIVITTINPPTKAVAEFCRLDDWSTYVVGDRKSPGGWQCPGAKYVPITPKKSRLAEALPENHYSRKMLGYVAAAAHGALVIAESDDDNIPRSGWSFPAFDGEYQTTAADLGFVNVYRSFTNQHIWPRGLPLSRVTDYRSHIDLSAATMSACRVGIWQSLADGDPDVDAIYRLTVGKACTFDQRSPLVLARRTTSPFNSQNTAFRAELFPLLYLPTTVTFRFTDILRGYVAQPVMWAAGFQLGFAAATVTQERNDHDYMKDFESELPCFLDVERCVDIIESSVRTDASVEENLLSAYEALTDAGITERGELGLLRLWLDALDDVR